MNAKRVKVTKDNIEEIRKNLDWHLVSLTLIKEREHMKKYAPKTAK